ncbi:AraC family transcriptional regulator [Roseovarius atlanticus]|uniref:AraC family transcriptional regulator n=1 Tax=Roseovarius atlanticus TaxID=1641875 RepID=A0A0T5NXR1_9RHOB|nr:GlxA family transcriptional regulator [Roseovarius atlanticus]KRS13700.1 AraC family transcriptional regulator [Roseovarius atlanticus]
MRDTDQPPKRYVFLLIPGFSMLGFTCALESLSLANRHSSNRTFYEWRLLSADGAPARAWNGVTVAVDGALEELRRDDTLVVCAGHAATAGSTRDVLAWLRRETRKGLSFGSLSSGAYTLALAGLIAGRRVSTHWEYVDALTEALPQVTVQDTIYSVDGRVFSCAGGASSMDLMLHLIGEDYGPKLVEYVAEQMVYTAPRDHSQSQRLSLPARVGRGNRRLTQAIEIMRGNIEDPLKLGELAAMVGVSVRQLERLFMAFLNTSPSRYYLEIRLEKARNLLRQTEMSITEISVLCGFTSPTHFSRAYRKLYSIAPSKEADATTPVSRPSGPAASRSRR